MDIRLTTVCNNDCLYCLETNIRNKYIDFLSISYNSICVYGGNLLYDKEFKNKLIFLKNKGIKIDAIQTNGYGLIENLEFLKSIGVKTINLKLHSFIDDQLEHVLSNNLFSLNFKDKIKLINLIIKKKFNFNVSYQLTYLNLKNVLYDIKFLYNFPIGNIDFVGPIPFGKGWNNKKKVLINFNNGKNKKQLELLLSYLKSNKRKVNFLKVPKVFFGKNIEFYDFYKGILNQISKEDIKIINGKKSPYCYPFRCNYCFLQDVCKFYDRKNFS